jgi:hypothetical protein
MSKKRRENLDGFGAHLLLICKEGEAIKIERERLILALYEEWVLDHSL